MALGAGACALSAGFWALGVWGLGSGMMGHWGLGFLVIGSWVLGVAFWALARGREPWAYLKRDDAAIVLRYVNKVRNLFRTEMASK